MFGLAVIVMGAFGYLEYVVLSHLLAPCNQADVLFVVLAVSPIVAVTAIVIFLLIGVFRGYRNTDMAHLPVEAILKGLGGD